MQPAVPLERQNGIFRSAGVPPALHTSFFLLLKMLLACAAPPGARFARTLPALDSHHHASFCPAALSWGSPPVLQGLPGPHRVPKVQLAQTLGVLGALQGWGHPPSSGCRSLERRARFCCLQTCAWAAALLPWQCGTSVC